MRRRNNNNLKVEGVEQANSDNPRQTRLIDDSELKRALKGVKIRAELFDKLLKYDANESGNLKPEGKVRVSWIVRLIRELGYDSGQIDIEIPAGRVGRAAEVGGDTVHADIVVYRDYLRTEPFTVIEMKAPNKKGGTLQAESYARNLGAEYHVWHDSKHSPRFYRTSRYPEKSEPIGAIPRWIGTKPVVAEVSKTEPLLPFRDEPHLRGVVHQCHELILEKQGHDPAKAFDELTKLLFLKLYDEREVPSIYKFMVLANEGSREVATKLRSLLKEAAVASKYRDVFYSKYQRVVDVNLDLDDFVIFNVVKLLQSFSLINTTENIQGADIKGTVFEQMVGNTFRGELAQFFTPRELVQFIVDIVPPSKNDKIFDPACGSGGFLIMAIRSLKNRLKKEHPNLSESELGAQIRHFAEHNLFGADINDRMARVAKMNMIMHGDGHAGIVNTNGLLTEKVAPDWWLRELKEGEVDIIYSNPPFAGREKDEDILKKFYLGKNKKGHPRSVSKEVLFIELVIKLLKVGGRAGLVLPSGIFNNPSMKYVRDYIKSQVKIVALVGLPHLSFQVTGANNEGHLLFIEKVKKVPKDYNIFIDWSPNIGIDSVGEKTGQNDLLAIVKRFRSPPPQNIIKFSQLKDRIDPWHYHPNYARLKKGLRKIGHPWVRLKDIFHQSENWFNRSNWLGSPIRYIEKGDVDMERGIIVSFSEHTLETLPTWAHWILKEGDILFPRAYDSMRGIAIVPNEYAGFVCTGGLIVVKHDPKKIVLPYARCHFSRPEILALIKQFETGEINPKYTWKGLSNVKVPLPPRDEQERILKEIAVVEGRKEPMLKALKDFEQKIDAKIREAVPKIIENYEEIKIKRAEFIGNVALKKR